MNLYRGMSSLEQMAWEEEGIIPRGKLFSTLRGDSIYYGKLHLYEGKLLVATLPFDDVLFDLFSVGKPPFSGDWYKNNRDLLLTEIDFSFTRTRVQVPRTSQASSQCSISGFS